MRHLSLSFLQNNTNSQQHSALEQRSHTLLFSRGCCQDQKVWQTEKCGVYFIEQFKLWTKKRMSIFMIIVSKTDAYLHVFSFKLNTHYFKS